MIARILRSYNNFPKIISSKRIIQTEKSFHNHLVLRNLNYFSRKKKQNLQKNMNESINKLIQNESQKNNQLKSSKVFFKNYQNLNFENRFSRMWYLSIIIGLVLYYSRNPDNQKQKFARQKEDNQTSYTVVLQHQMRQLIVNGLVLNNSMQISRVPIFNDRKVHYSNQCMIKGMNGQNIISDITNLLQFITFIQKQPIDYKVSFAYRQGIHNSQNNIFSFLVNLIFFGGLAYIFIKFYKSINQGGLKGGLDFMDKKKIQAIKPQNINVLFKDVAGMHQAKFEVTQFVDFLKTPERYIQMGAKIPKGALLTGPPGTGKTLLAKACAGQAGVPFYYVSGSDFVQKYVGLGASRVRKLFDQAQKNSPSIVFIDQIDAIGKKRQSGPFANQQANNTLNQLLVRMDGFDSQNKVIVMAATNIKDTLDPALLRPGRFDRSIQIGLPNFDERKQILQVHLKKIKFDSSFTIQEIANKISILTPGFSGAQLANVCNQAAILAARQQRQFIQIKHFEKATQRVMAGLQKRNLFTQQQKHLLAYYESGKAVIGWFTQGSDPVIKISILPFSKASKGYSHTIRDQIGLNTLQQLLGKACFYLSGRSSQNYFKSYVSTNGDQDLKRAKRIITLIVTKFGMSQKLKMIAFPDTQFVRKPYSIQTQAKIDQQIQRITNECRKKVQNMIIQKAQLIEKLKQSLLKKQTLNHNEIKQILGERPFSSNQNYQKFRKQERHVNPVNALQGSQKLSQNKQ